MQFQNRKGDWSGYLYDDVPMGVFVDIVTAESQGVAFEQLVKKAGYTWRKALPSDIQAI